MQTFRRTILQTSRRLARSRSHQTPHRHESGSSHSSPNATPSQPVNESFGTGFYVALIAVPVSLSIYKFTLSGDEQPWLSRYITQTYDGLATKWARRNDFHTQAMEQAAADKVLFLTEVNQSPRWVDLRFPEQFNTGSPWNVQAGQGGANLDKIIAKYEKEAYAHNEKRLQQLREGSIPAEQPFKPLTRSTTGTPPA